MHTQLHYIESSSQKDWCNVGALSEGLDADAHIGGHSSIC